MKDTTDPYFVLYESLSLDNTAFEANWRSFTNLDMATRYAQWTKTKDTIFRNVVGPLAVVEGEPQTIQMDETRNIQV